MAKSPVSGLPFGSLQRVSTQEGEPSWAYDPEADKWSVQWKEQKSSSQSLDILKQKVEKWKAASEKAQKEQALASPAPAKAAQAHFGIASIFGEGNHSLRLENALTDPLIDQSKNKVHGYSVKASADAQGQMVIDRYQASTPGASWESARSHHLFLMRFDALDEDEQAWWGDFLRAREKMSLVIGARQAIYDAWSRKKEDETQFVQVNHAGVVQPIERKNAKGGPYRTWALSKKWQLICEKDVSDDRSAWNANGGKWERKGACIALILGQYSPIFSVSHDALGVVYESSDFKSAFKIAQTTVEAMSQSADPAIMWKLNEWVGKRGNHSSDKLDWQPTQTLVRSVAALLLPDHQGSRSEQSKMLALAWGESSHLRPSGWAWESFSQESAYREAPSTQRYSSLGVEDAALELMHDVSALLTPSLTALEEQGDVREHLIRQSKQSVKGARDAVLDGEPLAQDPKHAIESWHRLLGAMQARAQAHPEVQAFEKQCADLVNKAKSLLKDTPDAKWVKENQPTPPAEAKARSLKF